MTRNRAALLIALIIAVGAIAGGIVYAQEASTPEALALQAFDLQTADADAFGDFNLFFQGGAYLGIYAEEITTENFARYGLRDVRGVGITQVAKDSPAERAGLRKDDAIVRFDGESVTSARKLSRLVAEASPDHTVRLTISRGGAEQEVSVTLGKRPGLTAAMAAPKIRENIFKNFPQNGDGTFVFAYGGGRRLGVTTENLTKQLSDYFGAKDGGVLITSVSENSPAAKAGLKAGDVVTAIDGEKVTSSGDISRAINKKDDGSVNLTILRDHNTITVPVTPEKPAERTIVKPGTRRVMIPEIEMPTLPDIDIKIPSITIPAIPRIEVEVPATPKVTRTRVVII